MCHVSFFLPWNYITRKHVEGIMAVISQTRGSANITFYGHAGSRLWLLRLPYELNGACSEITISTLHSRLTGRAWNSWFRRSNLRTRERPMTQDAEVWKIALVWEITQEFKKCCRCWQLFCMCKCSVLSLNASQLSWFLN